MNLFDLASQNSEKLQLNYQEKVCQFEADDLLPSLQSFVEQVKSQARLSFNMRQASINGMMSSSKHKNMYELAVEAATSDPTKSRDQILRERLKSYYDGRIAFDRAFDDGEKFRYSALNIGGLGAANYGEYCVVLTRQFWADCPYLAFIREDSLRGYVSGSIIDIDRLKAEIADKQHVHLLAASKHQDDLQTQQMDKWASMVCNSSMYIEAITKQDIPVAVVDSVRVSRQQYRLRYDELFQAYQGGSEAAQRRARAFRDLLEHLKNHQIELEVIDED
jgi:hypothetical protein